VTVLNYFNRLHQDKCSLLKLALFIVAVYGAITLICLFAFGKALGRDLSKTKNFQGLGYDGWFEKKATFSYVGLNTSQIFNSYIELAFDSWRPPNFKDNPLTISLCGKPTEILAARGAVVRVSIANCDEQVKLDFKFSHSFRGSQGDSRALAAKIKYIKFNSRLFVPVIQLKPLFLASSFLLIFFLLIFVCLNKIFLSLPLFFLEIYLLFTIETSNFTQYFWHIFVVGLFLLGFKSGAVLKRDQISKPLSIAFENFIKQRFILFLVVILLVTAGFRFYGVDFGLKNGFHPDENRKVITVSNMINNGTLDPNYFLHPTLLLYTSGVSSFLVNYFTDLNQSSSILLGGRLVSACAGVLSVLLTALSARILFGSAIAIFSALFLAVSPLHITSSRYLKEDSLLLFWTLLSLYLMLKAVFEKRDRLIYLSAITAGFAIGTKYSGAMVILIPLAAPWLASSSYLIPDFKLLKKSFLSILLVPIIFFITTPYSIFNFSKFKVDINYEKSHMLLGHTHAIDAWSQYWMYHFSYSLIPGLSPLLTFLAVLGAGVLVAKWKKAGLLVVGIALMFYLPAEWVKAKPAPQPERYIYQCLPFFSIAAAYLLNQLVYLSQGATYKRFFVAVIFLISILLPTARSLSLASEIKDDTRLIAGRWLVENTSPGGLVLFEWVPYAPRVDNQNVRVKYILRAHLDEMLNVDTLKSFDAEYLAISGLFFDRYFKQPRASQKAKSLYKKLFDELPIAKMIESRAGTYGFHNPEIVIFSLKQNDLDSFNKNLELGRKKNLEQHRNFFNNCGLHNFMTMRGCKRLSSVATH
jgi:hypothetical protein